MNKRLKIIIIAFLTFTSGVISQAKVTKATADNHRKVVRAGKASWYSKQSPGINLRTANNEIFDDTDLTCAMWGVPFNQPIRVTNKANGKSIIVRVNDRGPHFRFYRQGRIIDLSKGAFSKIASLKKGLIEVELEILDL